jgi:hypothetical protein
MVGILNMAIIEGIGGGILFKEIACTKYYPRRQI